MKKIQLSILTLALILSSCSSLQQIITEPTSLETISAVKEVLNSSAFRAVKTLRKLNKEGVDESAGIIEDAVKELKFKDAVKIVVGGENAATSALRQAMYGSVKKRYSSRLETELGKSEITQYWPVAANAYNLFAKKKVDGSLSDFMAERAVDALFIGMGKEESKIRKDPKKLGKAVVTKVFDYYQKKKKKG